MSHPGGGAHHERSTTEVSAAPRTERLSVVITEVRDLGHHELGDRRLNSTIPNKQRSTCPSLKIKSTKAESSKVTTVGDEEVLNAGTSAYEQGSLIDPFIDAAERQIRSLLETLHHLRREKAHWLAGGDGERRTAATVHRVLMDLGAADWHLLSDRRWPGSRGNIDLILVGPPGVLVLDAKAWREASIRDGMLFHGQAPAQDELDKVRAQAEAVAEALAHTGLVPAAVLPFLVLVGRRMEPVPLGAVTVAGELSLQNALMRLRTRLDQKGIERLVDDIDRELEPASPRADTRPRITIVQPSTPTRPIAEPLVRKDEVWRDALALAMQEPIESWMTWLHPSQSQLITRRWNGPARIRGAAGTGKTVVALHRARELARDPRARVLVTSFVRTLPRVHKTLFSRMAPHHIDRVDFTSVHALSHRIVSDQGEPPRIAPRGGRAIFDAAYRACPEARKLLSQGIDSDYLWEEVQSVIKGRDIADLAPYLKVARVGRHTRLLPEQRRLVWTIHLEYRRRLAEQGLVDWSDLVNIAVRLTEGADPLYTHAIVDEVQDLNCSALRLLRQVTEDGPDSLLLVGDGQQSVYPGGFTLQEAGLSVVGRSVVLDHNYRNRRAIMAAALEMVSGDSFDDLDDKPYPGARGVIVDQPGGMVLRVGAEDEASEAIAMVDALRACVDQGLRMADMAVLVSSNRASERYVRLLQKTGLSAVSLANYDGRATDAVKVGTYQRAKGLEFSCVFVPDLQDAIPQQQPDESDEVFRERAERQRRLLFVAMTRARERLWMGKVEVH